MSYKVGDEVICMDDNWNSDFFGLHNKDILKITKISQEQDSSIIYLYFDDKWGFDSSAFRPKYIDDFNKEFDRLIKE